MWIYTEAAISIRSRHGNFISKLHSITETVDTTRLHRTQESKVMWFLNDVLIKVGVFQACHDKTSKQNIETSFTCPCGERHTPRSAFVEIHHLMMVHYMQGWAWRLERDM